MRLLVLLIVFHLYQYESQAQLPLLNGSWQGAYSSDQADIFSSVTNLSSLSRLMAPALAIGGQRPLGLEELAVY